MASATRRKPTNQAANGACVETAKGSAADESAIAACLKAHAEWEAARQDVGVRIEAVAPNGKVWCVDYELPDDRGVRATTVAKRAPYGMVAVPWASLPHPVGRPTNKRWRAAYEKCATARERLAAAISNLARSPDADLAKELRDERSRKALVVARTLQASPWVWRTRGEVDLARDLVDWIGTCRFAQTDQKREAEKAEHARKKHEADLQWIEYVKTLGKTPIKKDPRSWTLSDCRNDAVCQAMAKALHEGPKGGLRQKALDSSTTAKGRRQIMANHQLIEQSRERMPWRLTEKGRREFGL